MVLAPRIGIPYRMNIVAAPNRNQHWVPRFYLRYFATAETRDTKQPMVWAFPVKEGEEFVTQTRNVAAKRDLYAFCEPAVDKRLTDLESRLGEFWPRIIEDCYPISADFKRESVYLSRHSTSGTRRS